MVVHRSIQSSYTKSSHPKSSYRLLGSRVYCGSTKNDKSKLFARAIQDIHKLLEDKNLNLSVPALVEKIYSRDYDVRLGTIREAIRSESFFGGLTECLSASGNKILAYLAYLYDEKCFDTNSGCINIQQTKENIRSFFNKTKKIRFDNSALRNIKFNSQDNYLSFGKKRYANLTTLSKKEDIDKVRERASVAFKNVNGNMQTVLKELQNKNILKATEEVQKQAAFSYEKLFFCTGEKFDIPIIFKGNTLGDKQLSISKTLYFFNQLTKLNIDYTIISFQQDKSAINRIFLDLDARDTQSQFQYIEWARNYFSHVSSENSATNQWFFQYVLPSKEVISTSLFPPQATSHAIPPNEEEFAALLFDSLQLSVQDKLRMYDELDKLIKKISGIKVRINKNKEGELREKWENLFRNEMKQLDKYKILNVTLVKNVILVLNTEDNQWQVMKDAHLTPLFIEIHKKKMGLSRPPNEDESHNKRMVKV